MTKNLDKQYHQETEFILNLILEFERREQGRDIHMKLWSQMYFVNRLRRKLRKGRFAEFIDHKKDGLLEIHGKSLNNHYFVEVEKKPLLEGPYKVIGIYFSVLIDPEIIDDFKKKPKLRELLAFYDATFKSEVI